LGGVEWNNGCKGWENTFRKKAACPGSSIHLVGLEKHWAKKQGNDPRKRYMLSKKERRQIEKGLSGHGPKRVQKE